MSTREFDVVVYGATGYTGRLVAEYLAGLRCRACLPLGHGRSLPEQAGSRSGRDRRA